MFIVKLSDGRFVNLANMTRTEEPDYGKGIRVYWNFIFDGDFAYTNFYGDDAQAIIRALENSTARFQRAM